MASQWLGNVVDLLGTALGLKESGYSERIAGYQPTVNTGYQASTGATSNLQNWKTQNFDVGSGSSNSIPTPQSSVNNNGSYSASNTPTNNNDSNQQQSPQPQFNQGPSQQEIDDAFNPIFQNLDNQEAQSRSFYDSEKADLLSSQTSQIDRLGEQKTSTYENMDLEKSDFNRQVESALDQAVRAYNALAQRARGYGGGNSASRAIGELAQREFARQQGGINQTALSQTAKYQKAVKDTELFFINTEKDIKDQYQGALKDLMNSYVEENNRIRQMRTESEVSKRQYRLEVKNQVANLENQLMASWKEQTDSLKVWKEQQDYMLNQELEATVKNAYDTPENLFQDQQNKLSFGQTSTNDGGNLALAKRVMNREDDDFQDFWA